MEYTTSEIVLAVIIVDIVIFGIFCLIDLIPDDVNDPLDKKERFEKMSEEELQLYDHEGNICNIGDILYDKKGYKYIFRGIAYVEPHGLIQKFLSVGNAGYKAVLSLIPSDKLYYADTIYVETEYVSEWYSHSEWS